MTIRRVELRLDVSQAVPPFAKQTIAATVFLPQPKRLASPPVVIFASPGGGYSRQYFDLQFEGHENYSEAAYHVAKGTIFIAYDHLGVGESTTDKVDSLSIEMLADANDFMVRGILARLEAGIEESFPKIIAPFTVGMGQSMGAGITIVMQGRKKTFDAVGILGVSAIHTRVPQVTVKAAAQALAAYRFTRATPLADLSIAATAAEVPDFHYPFHWEDVPDDILKLDMAGGYPLRKSSPYFGSMTIPICAVAMMSPGFFTPEAAAIEVPVFIGVGERDVCASPLLEPSAYASSKDVSLYIVPRMAHMHNFASTRELLWRRFEDWSRLVAVTPAT